MYLIVGTAYTTLKKSSAEAAVFGAPSSTFLPWATATRRGRL